MNNCGWIELRDEYLIKSFKDLSMPETMGNNVLQRHQLNQMPARYSNELTLDPNAFRFIPFSNFMEN